MIIWEKFLPNKEINETFYKRFKSKAEELTVTVLRVPSAEEATHLIIDQINNLKVKKVISTPLKLLNMKKLKHFTVSAALDFSIQLDRTKIEAAEMGISEFDMGIAELGSIFQDASDLHTRLVSMLPPIHLTLLQTTSMVESFADALQVIEKACYGEVPPYLSFITGPSITADIERELTIGVHGPEKLIVLCIDKI